MPAPLPAVPRARGASPLAGGGGGDGDGGAAALRALPVRRGRHAHGPAPGESARARGACRAPAAGAELRPPALHRAGTERAPAPSGHGRGHRAGTGTGTERTRAPSGHGRPVKGCQPQGGGGVGTASCAPLPAVCKLALPL